MKDEKRRGGPSCPKHLQHGDRPTTRVSGFLAGRIFETGNSLEFGHPSAEASAYDGARMGMVLSLDALPSSWWEIDVEVLLPSGTSVACTSSPRAPADAKTVTLFCPTVALDALPACDSTITLELNPRSSTYPDSTGTHALCAGTGGRQIRVSVPVTCPDSCGTPSNGRSCNVLGRTCNYTMMAYGGGGGTSTASLPCSCLWNDLLNALAWSCAVP
jgi:hypothetical protein